LDSLSTMSRDWISHKLWARPKSMFSAFIFEYLGESQRSASLFESARVGLEKKVQEQPDDPRYHSSLGIAYAGIGLKNEAVREGKRAVELLPLSEDAAYGIPYAQDLAVIYTMVGNYDAALKQIELLLSIPSWISPSWLQLNICFAPLYENPEFKKLIRKYSGNEL
jgi:tetratricopeptide (TPR) repeat protein